MKDESGVTTIDYDLIASTTKIGPQLSTIFSIVVSTIGLIVGGVLVGQDLINPRGR